ncbi:MAG TPA: hypothetical protein VLJ58_22120 [Ramlibacter sp.]|nr:hypothetical protein [Ramlibacter sp.]
MTPSNTDADRRAFLLGGTALAANFALLGCGGGGGGGPVAAPPPAVPAAALAPALDSLAADWMPTAAIASLPSIANFWGSVRAERDVAGAGMLAFAPYACHGRLGVLAVGPAGELAAAASRWHPAQLERTAVSGSLEVSSMLRMPLEERGLLVRVTLRNTGTAARTVDAALGFDLGVRRHPDAKWAGWDVPHGAPGNQASIASDGQMLLGVDAGSEAAMAVAFQRAGGTLEAFHGGGRVRWSLTLAPGESVQLGYVLAVAPTAAQAQALARPWAAQFDARFDDALSAMEARWQQIFRPGNAVFGGHLPVLETDDALLRSVWWHSALSAFSLARTNLPLASPVFATLAPVHGLTLSYFWDTEMFSAAYAMLAPASLKAMLRRWLALDLHAPDAYALDNLSLQSAGAWYAANDWAVFRSVESYLASTGDAAFLQEAVAGTTVLERMVAIATAYRSLVQPGSVLASYGENENLLETAPSYIHRVASLNAGNVYLLRRVAALLQAAGQAARADALRAEAQRQLDAVLQLYLPGDGVWQAEHLDGSRVQLRHVFDYIVVGQALGTDLAPGMRAEMTAFVQRELLAGNWMRAMSLQDAAAAQSLRPDHGTTGAYDGWPALSAEVMGRFGDFAGALALLRRVEPVLREGPFAQSHEILPDGRVRISGDPSQDFHEIAGASYLQTVVKGLFGLEPGLPGELNLRSPQVARGFTGTLKNVTWGGRQVTLTSDAAGVRAAFQ